MVSEPLTFFSENRLLSLGPLPLMFHLPFINAHTCMRAHALVIVCVFSPLEKLVQSSLNLSPTEVPAYCKWEKVQSPDTGHVITRKHKGRNMRELLIFSSFTLKI